jgi:Kef-type K+ transport system membrane component KefB
MNDLSLALVVGLIFFLGYLGGLLANRFGLPKVSGYVLVGMAMSPTVTGVISEEFLKAATIVVEFALAMVAYSLGGHLKLRKIWEQGKVIGIMTYGQGTGAFVFVSVATLGFMHFYYPEYAFVDIAALAFLFGALSVSTAPAATIATVYEYKARGRFTSALLAIVALDDALGLLGFALSIAIVKSFVTGAAVSFSLILEPVESLLWSTGLGLAAGLVLVWAMKYMQKREALVILTTALFCITFGAAQQLGFEPLFATMVMGMTVANTYPGDAPFIFIEKSYEAVVFAIFFVLAGAHIDVSLLVEYLPLAVLFVIFRMSGKWVGSYLGGVASGAPKGFSRYMGLGLAPQAGVAIGLALYIERIPGVAQYAPIAINVIIAKTAINEVLGPWLLKVALKKNRETDKA